MGPENNPPLRFAAYRGGLFIFFSTRDIIDGIDKKLDF
jgi:hypothetical protein